MANTAASVLKIAAGEIGYSRYSDPERGSKYGRWYAKKTGNAYFGTNGVPFCAMGVSWTFAQAGAKCAGIPNSYCPSIHAAAKKAGKVVATRNAQPGDVVLFDWDGNGTCDHVGLVELNNGYLQTIEFNVGGAVARRTRAYSTVGAVVRPDYDKAQPKPTPAPSKLVVDGVFGTLTCKALQERLQALGYYKGYKVDGVFGNATKREYQRYLKSLGIYSGVIDGVFGVMSVKAEQTRLKRLGYYSGIIDGARGPMTKKALQRALNDKRL